MTVDPSRLGQIGSGGGHGDGHEWMQLRSGFHRRLGREAGPQN